MKIETPILRRLGPVPFWRGTTRCLDEFQRIYTRAAIRAEETLRGATPTRGRTAGTVSRA